jgi:hypothetical protein
LPVTNICSSSFWRSEPIQYQSFDTIAVINDNLDTDDTESESQSVVASGPFLAISVYNDYLYAVSSNGKVFCLEV